MRAKNGKPKQTGKPKPDPTPAQIEQRKAAIRREWEARDQCCGRVQFVKRTYRLAGIQVVPASPVFGD